MKVLAAAFMLLAAIASTSFAGSEKAADDPMPPHMRAKFDRVMSGLWHEDCRCWRFIFESRIKEITPPINDDLRWSILKLIETGELTPIPKGPAT